MKNRPLTFAAIDFETANYSADSACSVGIVRVEGSRIVARDHYFIRPPSRRFVFTGLHGIAWHHVCDAPTFGDLYPTVLEKLAGVDFITAHGAHRAAPESAFAVLCKQATSLNSIHSRPKPWTSKMRDNASFDKRVFGSCCDTHGLDRPDTPFVCSVRLARKVLGIKPANLSHVCQRLRIPLQHHEALSDAEACARIVIAATNKGWCCSRSIGSVSH